MNKIALALFISISAFSGAFGNSFRNLRENWTQPGQNDLNDDTEHRSFLKQKRTLVGISALIVAAAAAYAHKTGLSTILCAKIVSFFKDTDLQKDTIEKKALVFERCKGEKSSNDVSNQALVEHIKKLGSDVVDENGKSPLHYAVNNGDCQLAAILIDECGINPENFPDLFECALTDKMKQFLISRNIPQAKKAFEEASKKSIRQTVKHLKNGANPSEVAGDCCYKVYPVLQGARLFNWTNKNVAKLLACRPFKSK